MSRLALVDGHGVTGEEWWVELKADVVASPESLRDMADNLRRWADLAEHLARVDADGEIEGDGDRVVSLAPCPTCGDTAGPRGRAGLVIRCRACGSPCGELRRQRA